MDKKKINFKEFFTKVKVEYLIVFALAIVALFIFLSSLNSEKTESIPIDAYVSGLEKSLENSLSSVRGAGKLCLRQRLKISTEKLLKRQF